MYEELPDDLYFIFFRAFTTSAFVAYALGNLYRSRSIPTALGGPHARSYPEDASNYFDYVFGFTDRELVQEVVRNRHFGRENGLGTYVTASGHPPRITNCSGAMSIH